MEIKAKREGVIAVDNGGFTTGVITSASQKMFPSAKGEFVQRTLKSRHGSYDFEVELEGKKYFAGTLVEHECDFPMIMHGDTKQDLFYDLSILIACHQFGYDMNYVSTCVPIKYCSPEEIRGIRQRLCKDWKLTVNGETRHFHIKDVTVAPECVVAFWHKRPFGKIRWVDWGSRTINWGTTESNGESMKFINRESGTFENKGLEATESQDFETLAKYVAGKLLSKWSKEDKIVHIGGGAKNQVIIDAFSQHFPNSEVHDKPQLATALGLYEVGRNAFKMA